MRHIVAILVSIFMILVGMPAIFRHFHAHFAFGMRLGLTVVGVVVAYAIVVEIGNVISRR
jgi:hypothetical protein